MTQLSRLVKFKLLFFILFSTLTFAAAGQNGSERNTATESTYPAEIDSQSSNSGMADLLRSNGMIYVVVGVVLIVLTGLILYLVSLDRKMRRLEKEFDEKQSEN